MKTQIPLENVKKLHAKISKLTRRAKRNNLPPMELNFGDVIEVAKFDAATNERWIEHYQEVELTGVMPVIEGWSFVAKIEHTEHGNVVKSMNTDLSMHYTTLDPNCEHCKSKRHRKETYILKNEKEMQVGTECIKNYMTLNSAEYILMLAEVTAAVRDSERENDDGIGGRRRQTIVDLENFVATTVQCVMKYGWQSSMFASREKGSEQGTGGKSWYNLTAKRDRDFHDYEIDPTEKARTLAKAYIEQMLATDHDTLFMHNMQVIMKKGYICFKDVNMIAVSAKNILQAEAERIAKIGILNEYVGKTKERLELELSIIKRIGFDTAYGYSIMFIMQDNKGRQFKTVNTGSFNAQVGDTVKIKGTIKGHEVYKEIKQTVLTRVQLVKSEVKEAV